MPYFIIKIRHMDKVPVLWILTYSLEKILLIDASNQIHHWQKKYG